MPDLKAYTGCNVCIDCRAYRHQEPANATQLPGCQCGHIDIAHANPEQLDFSEEADRV